MKRRTSRILFAAAVAAMALLAPAGSANAGLLSQSAGGVPQLRDEQGLLRGSTRSTTRSPPVAHFESGRRA